MEGTHGELCARFTDRLRGNNAHSFALIDHATTAQVAPVALGAQAKAGFAIERGAYFYLVNASGIEQVEHVFIKHFACFGKHCAGFGVQHFIGSGTTQNTVAQAFNNFTTFNNSAHDLAVVRAAIVFGYNQVLRYVYQAASEVARVGSFQRRISQTFTRTVGRNKVLQHVQAFTEVGFNGRFNN